MPVRFYQIECQVQSFFHHLRSSQENSVLPNRPFQSQLLKFNFERLPIEFNFQLPFIKFLFPDSSQRTDSCVLFCDQNKCIGRDEVCDVTTQCDDGKDEESCGKSEES